MPVPNAALPLAAVAQPSQGPMQSSPAPISAVVVDPPAAHVVSVLPLGRGPAIATGFSDEEAIRKSGSVLQVASSNFLIFSVLAILNAAFRADFLVANVALVLLGALVFFAAYHGVKSRNERWLCSYFGSMEVCFAASTTLAIVFLALVVAALAFQELYGAILSFLCCGLWAYAAYRAASLLCRLYALRARNNASAMAAVELALAVP